MPQQFLDGANIVTSFEQMRGKRMPECVAARGFGDPCLPYGCFHAPLQHQLTHMMPPCNTTPGVDRAFCRGEYVLPGPFSSSVRVLSLQGIWQVNAPKSRLQVLVMKFFNTLYMALHLSFDVQR